MRISLRRSPSHSRNALAYPLPRTPRVALFDDRIQSSRQVELFDANSDAELQRLIRFRPQAFAGSLRHLDEVARRIGSAVLRSFDIRAIVVFTTAGQPLLTTAERDELWSIFEAPVFEQYISARGELIASECEAHEGLHIRGIYDPQLLGGARIETRPCGCGESSPRVIPAPEASTEAAA